MFFFFISYANVKVLFFILKKKEINKIIIQLKKWQIYKDRYKTIKQIAKYEFIRH